MSQRKRMPKRKSFVTHKTDRTSNPVIPWLHGIASMGDERWEEAIASLQRFLEMVQDADDRRQTFQNLGACYLALEQYDDALAALDQAERYASQDPDILHSRGVTYACAGRIPEAIAVLQQFARMWPRQARHLETRKALRQLRGAQRGRIPVGTYLIDHLQEEIIHNTATGDWHLVERKARRIIAADPERPEGYFALGLSYLERDRCEESLEAFLAAHARDPKYEPTLYNIGHTYLRQGEPEKALSWLENALRLDPQDLATLHELGRACEQLGRRDEAAAWWRRALKIDPDYHLAKVRLHKVGLGPEPGDPPLPPAHEQLRVMMPIVKARMRQPKIYRNGALTLTYDGSVGFVLEDQDNDRNATIQAGRPFHTADISDEDLLDLIGLVKMLLRTIDSENTRHVTILTYYADRPTFLYTARYRDGEKVEFDHGGQFIVTEVPRFFKLRIDSDLSTPYGDPMQGMLIFLNQDPKPGILISTLEIGTT